MSRRLALAVIVGSLVLVIAFVALYRRGRGAAAEGVGGAIPLPGAGAAGELQPVTVYFPGQDGRLHPETRQVARSSEPIESVAEIVRALLAGPQNLELRPPVPAGTQLLGVDLDLDRRVAYIDLGGNEISGPFRGGSKVELLAVYSLVDSVVLNVAEVERVALLWNGQQGSTFAGHVDMTHPLGPDRSLLSRRP